MTVFLKMAISRKEDNPEAICFELSGLGDICGNHAAELVKASCAEHGLPLPEYGIRVPSGAWIFLSQAAVDDMQTGPINWAEIEAADIDRLDDDEPPGGRLNS